MDERRRRDSLVGPVILIGLGVVFLLNNLGVLSLNVWDAVFNLWPVLLIAAGLDILIGRRSGCGAVVSLLLTLALLVGALWLLETGVIGQTMTSEEIVQAVGGATQAKIELAPAVGDLQIEPLPASEDLVRGTVNLRSGERLEREFEVTDETASFALRSAGDFAGTCSAGQGWNLALSSDLPLDLETSIAVGQTDVDLTGLTVSDLEASMALGQITLILPDEGDFQARIDGAIGQIVIVIPEGMEARVRLDTALVGKQLPDEYQHQDDVYTSPGYAGAENRVDLQVDLAMGSVTIRH